MRSEDRRHPHRSGRGGRPRRYLSDIRTVAELRAARRELEIRERYARRRLDERASALFSVEGLLAAFAPPGSIADRLIGGVGTGLAVVRGIVGSVGSLFAGRETWSGRHVAPKPATRKPAAKKPAARKAPAKKN